MSDTQTELWNTPEDIAIKIWQKYFGDYAFVTRDGREPLIARKFVGDLEALIHSYVTQARIGENIYHWHHQKYITNLAMKGKVSGYFLDRQEELKKELK